jgi:hypothetical protein
MLQTLRHKGVKTIQGLWAELILIDRSLSPAEWVKAWHNDPMELHDFCLPAVRVEVKSSSARIRKHHFSHRQLCALPDADLFIASVYVERIANGKSVQDIASEIRGRVNPQEAFKLDEIIISTLGSDFPLAGEIRFDKGLAISSLRFFNLAQVPRIAETIPDGLGALPANCAV